MLFGIPIWVFLCIIFIFLSGYMAVKAMRAEHKLEHQFIEREGQVYIRRMEEERQQRKERNDSVASG